MSRVLMLVINPMTNDTRVEKEAASLAAAGHDVTVVATLADGLAAEEQRDGYTILRLPYRRTVKDRVLAPAIRLEAAARARGRAADALAAAGSSSPGPVSDVLWFLRRAVTRVRVLAGGALLKLIRARILVPEYWGSIGSRVPELVSRPDVIHAHDLGPLAAAVRLSRGWADPVTPRVVYDSHELYTEQQTSWTPREKLAWKLHERRWIRHADHVITVSSGIARELQRRYRLRELPTLVLNAPPATHDLAQSDVRTDCDVPEGATLAVYVGTVKPGRGVDRIVAAMPHGQWELAIVGAGAGTHVQDVQDLAADLGVADRIHILPGVPASTLPSYLATADVGVHAMENTCQNHDLALPNKLFDYLFAGLPVAVTDLAEMGSLVRGRDLGTVFDAAQPSAVHAAITAAAESGLSATGTVLAEFSWETQATRLLAMYSGLGPSGR